MTGTDITVVQPYTGEVLDLAGLSFAQLGELLDSCREWERAHLAAFKHDVQGEILRRMDERAATGQPGAWTIRAGDYKLAGDSPDRTEYPLDETRRELESLVRDGLLTEDAIERVIVPTGYKIARRPLSQLLKLGGEVKARLEAVERPVERPRRVTVTWERSQ